MLTKNSYNYIKEQLFAKHFVKTDNSQKAFAHDVKGTLKNQIVASTSVSTATNSSISAFVTMSGGTKRSTEFPAKFIR